MPLESAQVLLIAFGNMFGNQLECVANVAFRESLLSHIHVGNIQIQPQTLLGQVLLVDESGHADGRQDRCYRRAGSQRLVPHDPRSEFRNGSGAISFHHAMIQEGLQVFGEVEARGVALVLLSRHRFFTNRDEFRRRLRIELMDTLWRAIEHSCENCVR